MSGRSSERMGMSSKILRDMRPEQKTRGRPRKEPLPVPLPIPQTPKIKKEELLKPEIHKIEKKVSQSPQEMTTAVRKRKRVVRRRNVVHSDNEN